MRRALRAPSAESFAFNSYGACPACDGLGVRTEVDAATLVPDPAKSIDDGAVLPWNLGARRLYRYAAAELGVRTGVPYRSLSKRERDIVLHGPEVEQPVEFPSGKSRRIVRLNVTYENAIAAVERAQRSDNERTRAQVRKFLIVRTCSVCHGTRLRPEALASTLGGRNLAEISALRLDELRSFAAGLPAGLPDELAPLTAGLAGELDRGLAPLLEVGLGYLQLDRAGATLSAGERQRIELTSTVRASTTGMLYVLDEPSVGLHPSNVVGLRDAIGALAANGNTVVIVEHERDLITAADWIIELGPAAGAGGGTIIAQGTPRRAGRRPALDHRAVPGGHGRGAARPSRRRRPGPDGRVSVEVGELYNLRDVTAAVPAGRLTAVAGPSGAGKTALILDSLVPGRAGAPRRAAAARPRPFAGPGRHPPGRPDRRLAHRAERAVHAGHLLGGVRRHPPPVRRRARRPAPEVEARALLVQHPRGPVPDLPRPGQHRPGRAVPARHQRRVPDLPRRPVQRRDPERPRRRPHHRRRPRA